MLDSGVKGYSNQSVLDLDPERQAPGNLMSFSTICRHITCADPGCRGEVPGPMTPSFTIPKLTYPWSY